MLKNKFYALEEAFKLFESGEQNALVITKRPYEDGLKRVEVEMSKIKEINDRLNEEMTDLDLYESSLDEVESRRRLSVLPAIEELEELLRTERDLMKKKDLITLIDNLLWTEGQINKLKGHQ